MHKLRILTDKVQQFMEQCCDKLDSGALDKLVPICDGGGVLLTTSLPKKKWFVYFSNLVPVDISVGKLHGVCM